MLTDKTIEINSNAELSSRNYDNMLANYQETYEAGLKLIEVNSGIGMSIDEATEKYDSLSSEQKRALESAVGKIRELNEEFSLIPDKKYVDLVVRYFPEEAAGPKQTANFDMSSITKYEAHAKGGVFTKPHIGLIGEAGTEYLIPTTGENKTHGVSLWYQAGKALGLIKEHARGGIFGKGASYNPSRENDSGEIFVNTPITVNLGGMTFTFNGASGSDKNSIMETIRQQMPEIADDVANTIAEALKGVFPNLKANVS